MFLKEVYRYSKGMFAGMLLFGSAQLFINYKAGMVCTPFYHYGMYAQKQHAPQVYSIHTIIAGSDTLRGIQYSPQQWDKIYYTLQCAMLADTDTTFYKTQVQRLYTKAGLPAPAQKNFTNRYSSNVLLQNYKQWLPEQLGMHTHKIEIHTGAYRYSNGRFLPISIQAAYASP